MQRISDSHVLKTYDKFNELGGIMGRVAQFKFVYLLCCFISQWKTSFIFEGSE